MTYVANMITEKLFVLIAKFGAKLFYKQNFCSSKHCIMSVKNVQFKSTEEQILETTLANPVLQIPKEVVVCFDEYQKARIDFVVSTDALAQIPNNIPSMFAK